MEKYLKSIVHRMCIDRLLSRINFSFLPAKADAENVRKTINCLYDKFVCTERCEDCWKKNVVNKFNQSFHQDTLEVAVARACNYEAAAREAMVFLTPPSPPLPRPRNHQSSGLGFVPGSGQPCWRVLVKWRPPAGVVCLYIFFGCFSSLGTHYS